MESRLNPPLRPRGHTLEVLGIARISTLNQDERSLGDQEALYRRWLKKNYDGPFNLQMIASQGSGERLDREESSEAIKAVESRTKDLVLTEDLGRVYRRVHAYLFCELCMDHGTRLIALNDNVDTAQGTWSMAAIFGAMKHEASNKDTSERIKRTLRNRFLNGGVFIIPLFCHIKPPNAKGDADVQINPATVPILDEWFRRLENGATYCEVADYLIEMGFLLARIPATPNGPAEWSNALPSILFSRVCDNATSRCPFASTKRADTVPLTRRWKIF
jgi:site-specific DNA recombinase